MSVYVDENGYVVYTSSDFTKEEEEKAWSMAAEVNEDIDIATKRKRASMKRKALQHTRINKERKTWRNNYYRRPKTLLENAQEARRAALFHGKKTTFRQVPWSERQKNNYHKFVRERNCK